MPSANLYFGKNISLLEFKSYILDEFSQENIEVTDSLLVMNRIDSNSLLLAVTYSGNLETSIQRAVNNINSGSKSEYEKREFLSKLNDEDNYYLYEIIGQSEDDSRASELFPTIAKKELERSVCNELHRQISIRKRLKN